MNLTIPQGVLWSFGGDPPSHISVCYGTLMEYSNLITNPINLFCRLDRNTISPKQANFYLRNVVFPAIPERMHEAITSKRFYSRDFKRQTTGLNPINAGWPWLQLTVDGKKTNKDDFFILINLFRVPQQSPQVILKMLELMKKGYTQDFSLLVGLLVHGQPGHDLLCRASTLRVVAIPKGVKAWNLADSWEKANVSKDMLNKNLCVNHLFAKGLFTPSPQKLYALPENSWSERNEPTSNFGLYNYVEAGLLEAYKCA